MDISYTSLVAQQTAQTQSQIGMAVMKSAAKADQQVATILANAVEATGSANGQRGTQLDITV